MPRTVQRFGSWRESTSTIVAGGSWEQYCGPRYELIKLRKLCAGDTPRAHWIGGERLLKNLFAPELPEELFRKVITFWAPVWR